MQLLRALAIATSLLSAVLAVPALAAGRVALVIGNGAYVNATELPNPANDAQAIAAALGNIGFEVITGVDLTRAGMEEKLREYVTAIEDADTALFYYSGHGLQVNGGKNYLVPVDAALENAASLDFEMIEADKVFGYMGGNDRIALAFLDACRDNPLSRRLARKTRSGAVEAGLAVPQTAGTGLFIGFSTSPDDVALDGDGEHSPFTEAMLKHLATPGLEINQMMVRVKADVRQITQDDQRPWTNSDLSTEVYLVPGERVAEQPQTVETPTLDQQMWEKIADSDDPSAYELFKRMFPDSPHIGDADQKLASLVEPVETPDPVDLPVVTEPAQKPRFGVEIRNLTDEVADPAGLRRGYGVEVVRVMPGGIAEQTGVLAGDILLDFNNQELNDMQELILIVTDMVEQGQPDVPVLLYRDGQTITLNASFSPQPAEVPSSRRVAELIDIDDMGKHFTIGADVATGRLTMRQNETGEAIPTDKKPELWMISGQGAPVSMGTLTEGEDHVLPIVDGILLGLNDDVHFVVTLEQSGGSPTGLAQGPIVAQGSALR